MITLLAARLFLSVDVGSTSHCRMCLLSALSVLLQQVPMAQSLNHRALGNLVGFHLFPPVTALDGAGQHGSSLELPFSASASSRQQNKNRRLGVRRRRPWPATLESFLALDDARLTSLNGRLGLDKVIWRSHWFQ
ncbi:hypothetical protein BKA56DRAFT_581212 [Ilyonectria sp. MPI-CAGE-AT-0026]|nr:hypothetical protein BKA56DRAFT_581212 [Ilyonectria sp. MPI-CAGE-AT-0026]